MAVLIELDFDLEMTGVAAQPLRSRTGGTARSSTTCPTSSSPSARGAARVIDVKPADRVDK